MGLRKTSNLCSIGNYFLNERVKLNTSAKSVLGLLSAEKTVRLFTFNHMVNLRDRFAKCIRNSVSDHRRCGMKLSGVANDRIRQAGISEGRSIDLVSGFT